MARFGVYDNTSGELVSPDLHPTRDEALRDYHYNHGHTHVAAVPHVTCEHARATEYPNARMYCDLCKQTILWDCDDQRFVHLDNDSDECPVAVKTDALNRRWVN